MSKLVDLFLQPSRVFEAERERPTFLVPLAIVVLVTAAFTLAYFMRVDPAWYSEHVLASLGRELSAAEAAKVKASMPGTRTQGVIATVTGAVAVVLASMLVALYVWLAAKVTGRTLGFRHGMSLSTWSGLPMALGLLVALAGALTMAPQTALESQRAPAAVGQRGDGRGSLHGQQAQQQHAQQLGPGHRGRAAAHAAGVRSDRAHSLTSNP